MVYNPTEPTGSPKENNTHKVLKLSPHLKPPNQLNHERQHYVSKTWGIKQIPSDPNLCHLVLDVLHKLNIISYFQRSAEESSTNGKNLTKYSCSYSTVY